VVDHRRAVDHPRKAHPRACTAASLGTHDPGLLLRSPDVQHAFVALEVPQILLRDVVLALVLAKAHQVNPAVGHEMLDGPHEGRGLRCHCRRRGETLAEVAAQVPHHAAHALQLRHVDVEVHPVDALALEHDVLAQDFANAVW